MIPFDHYRPEAVWFRHNPHGIHGLGHAARVFVWANLIGNHLRSGDSQKINLEVIRWSAVLHDVGRLSDGIDQGHGERSAEWIIRNRNLLPLSLEDES